MRAAYQILRRVQQVRNEYPRCSGFILLISELALIWAVLFATHMVNP